MLNESSLLLRNLCRVEEGIDYCRFCCDGHGLHDHLARIAVDLEEAKHRLLALQSLITQRELESRRRSTDAS